MTVEALLAVTAAAAAAATDTRNTHYKGKWRRRERKGEKEGKIGVSFGTPRSYALPTRENAPVCKSP